MHIGIENKRKIEKVNFIFLAGQNFTKYLFPSNISNQNHTTSIG
jgi:hypothetical protein